MSNNNFLNTSLATLENSFDSGVKDFPGLQHALILTDSAPPTLPPDAFEPVHRLDGTVAKSADGPLVFAVRPSFESEFDKAPDSLATWAHFLDSGTSDTPDLKASVLIGQTLAKIDGEQAAVLSKFGGYLQNRDGRASASFYSVLYSRSDDQQESGLEFFRTQADEAYRLVVDSPELSEDSWSRILFADEAWHSQAYHHLWLVGLLLKRRKNEIPTIGMAEARPQLVEPPHIGPKLAKLSPAAI